eukprot:gene13469-19327_t
MDMNMDMNMDVLGPYPSASDAPCNVLISDVKPEDLPFKISKALGKDYLSEMATCSGSVHGIVCNTKEDKLRVLVSLPVCIRGKSVATHFIFDTGAPKTYLALSVLQALGVPEVSLPNEVVKVNGVKALVTVSDSAKNVGRLKVHIKGTLSPLLNNNHVKFFSSLQILNCMMWM